jgi:hypothetical protein
VPVAWLGGGVAALLAVVAGTAAVLRRRSRPTG